MSAIVLLFDAINWSTRRASGALILIQQFSKVLCWSSCLAVDWL